ncbi:MAG: hypothetical protein DWQ02_25995 [Bacteroidetes bacterium]|nr:MAG: hypothetical protein DWQ02_25995 [Bacteroidota bacterium]
MKLNVNLMFFNNWKTGFFSLCSLAVLFISSCDIINPEEEIPAYIRIESVDLKTYPGEGSDDHAITDIWLSVDSEFLGVYPLPATIPLLEKGEHLISLQAGIKDNGINSTPDIYPFYAPFEVTVNLEEDVVKDLSPVFEYYENVQFSFIEEFEGTGQIFQEIRIGDPEYEIGLSTQAENIFEGDHSGVVRLDTGNNVIEIGTLSRYQDLGDNGYQTYLEVNYKSDVPVFFGLIGYENIGSLGGTSLYEGGFLQSTSWNKIYFNLAKPVLTAGYEEYQVGFQAYIPEQDGILTLDSAKVFLDNIKLVHF